MESSSDKNWAAKYLLDPLNDPEPSQETGLGSHFYPITPSSPTSSHKRHSSTSTAKTPLTSVAGLPTPPESASPTRSSFHPSNPYSPSYRHSAFSGYSPEAHRHSRRSLDGHIGAGKQRRRTNSPLDERFPGDMSHRPLDQIRKEVKTAHRSPHLRKKYTPGTDIIDSLDTIGGAYHHEGPYDATLLARNLNPKNSPVAATRSTNEEAINATPTDFMKDSLNKHLPLQGTAVVPPGEQALDGKIMRYEEGADLQRETDAPGGAYKRWPDMHYHPEDFKGKGEPSFSVDRALKKDKDQYNTHRRIVSDGASAYEMQTPRSRPSRPNTTRQRSASGNNADLGRPSASATALGTRNSTSGSNLTYAEFQADMDRRNSTGHSFGEGLKRRFGSMKRNIKV